MLLALSGVGVYGNGSLYDGIFMLWDGVGLGVLGGARTHTHTHTHTHPNQSINLTINK